MPWGNAAAPLAARQAALAHAIQRIPDAASWPFPPATAGGQGGVRECQYWPPARPDPAAPAGRALTMPVLLLAGELDLSTPLPWAREEAAQIPHARLVVINGAGHSTQLHSARAAAAAEAFLLAPGDQATSAQPGRSALAQRS